MRCSLWLIGAASVALAVYAPLGRSQSPAFEVASIKPSRDVVPMMVVVPGFRNGTLHGEKITTRMLVATAYGVTPALVVGPDSLDKGRFGIMAKAPEGTPNSDLRPMLQSLLKDRFKLIAHMEKKESNVYFLRLGRGGVKMPKYPAPDGGPKKPGDPRYSGFPMLRGTRTTSQLAQLLSRVVNSPVIDQTGLTERYSYFLSYAPISRQTSEHPADFGPPDIFTAVEEQLGLKLQAGRSLVDTVAVDHIERMPTEN